jgi:hypothetical protein
MNPVTLNGLLPYQRNLKTNQSLLTRLTTTGQPIKIIFLNLKKFKSPLARHSTGEMEQTKQEMTA